MDWDLDKKRPICPQICEKLCVMIASGDIASQEKLLSVREVAVAAGVNPNTVQKSYEELERQGLIFSVRGSGWFVREDTEAAKQTVIKLVSDKTSEYFESMQKLGFDTQSVKKYVEEWME